VTFENEFTVQAPIDEVWATLLDLERVAPCMPGAEVTERVGDDAYKVSVRVKLGPMSMTYRGEVQIVDRDDASRAATMQVKAKEARGQGTADARVRMSLAEEESGGTRATIDTDVQMSGKVAAMGQSVIGDVSARLIQTFAGNLAEMLSENGGAAGASLAEPATAAALSDVPAEPTPTPTRASPPPSRRQPDAENALPAGELVAAVIVGRLQNPRTLLAVALVFAIVFLLIGFVIGRLA
jgi:carbon monoxide dehydrogenase subunit G